MLAHQVVNSAVKRFRVKNGKVTWTKAHIDGDRKKVCISRKSKGKLYKRYVSPSTEIDVL